MTIESNLPLIVALLRGEMKGTPLEASLRTDAAMQAVRSGVLQLKRTLEAARALRDLALNPDAKPAARSLGYQEFASALAKFVGSFRPLLPVAASERCVTGVAEPQANDCARAAFGAAAHITLALEAARAGDFSRLYVEFMQAISPFVAKERPGWMQTYLPFFVSLATAEDAAAVERSLDALAAPLGSFMAKRKSMAGFTKLTLSAYLGCWGRRGLAQQRSPARGQDRPLYADRRRGREEPAVLVVGRGVLLSDRFGGIA